MVQQLFDDLLHLRTKHTNMMIPFSEYIGIDKYPEQADDIGTIIRMKYRDNSKIDYNEYKNADLYDPHDVFEKHFMIVRHDKDKPGRFIAISTDYSIILIKTRDNYPEDKEIILRYPIQCTNIIGLEVQDQYVGIQSTVSATILRADTTEPCFVLLVEEIGGRIRFILGDECMSKISPIYYDYDGKYANTNQPIEEDLNGKEFNSQFIKPTIMADGGNASWKSANPDKRPRIEDLGEPKNERQIQEIVRKCVEGKEIWS